VASSPDQQIAILESHLQQLEDDFQPPAAQPTEIELVYRDTGLFGDGFAEEEIVFDRHGSLEADLFDRRLVVASREGAELGQLLAQHVRPPAEATLPMRSEAVQPNPREVAANRPADIAAESGQFDTDQFQAAGAAAQATVVQTSSTTLAAESMPEYDFEADSDADMIVVEDDSHGTVRHVPAPLVRKQEYRQLFAKLRRG
jgi:hypothetical protein